MSSAINSKLSSEIGLKQANSLLRNQRWNEALEKYIELLSSLHPLDEQISWNIRYLLRKAPVGTGSASLVDASMKMLESTAYMRGKETDSAFKNAISSNEVGKLLDTYISRKIAEKKIKRQPDERGVLSLATEIARDIGYTAAQIYAERFLPDKLKYTLHSLNANAAIDSGNEVAWLVEINEYLKNFGLASLKLVNGANILDRLSTDVVLKTAHGPLVTVIMPAWNAGETLGAAARSILNQTWRTIELIIVDDASTDNTWNVAKVLASEDDRVKILKNKINVGPYVSKNIALKSSIGAYVTGHDADDWAHPQRIENHMKEVLQSGGNLKASVTYMLRIDPKGYLTKFGLAESAYYFDGVARLASISCMFEKNSLLTKLGFWDSVRFGADSEMINRATKCFGDGFSHLKQIGMICLDLDTSLTNDPVEGISSNNGRLSASRQNYKNSWKNLHDKELAQESLYIAFPQVERIYSAPSEMVVPYSDQVANMGH